MPARPPDLPDPQTLGSTVWEAELGDPKAHVRATQARSSGVDEGAHPCPDPQPSLGVITTDPDTCP